MDESKWLAVRSIEVGCHTPFNRLKNSWLTVYPASISATSNKTHAWSSDGSVLTLITAHGEPVEVKLSDIAPAVESLIKDLNSLLASLFPGGMELPPEPELNIKDSFCFEESFIDNEGFQEVMSPFYSHFIDAMQSPKETKHAIWSEGRFQLENFNQW